MNSLLALLLVTGSNTHYVDTSLDFDGELLSWSLQDIDGDERRELIVALRHSEGERELHVHRITDAGVELTPSHTVSVLADVVAWSCADVREEAGRELIFLTGGGAWSYSLTHPGYRDNVRALARAELVYDVPDFGSLPFFGYVVPGAERDAILLPGRGGYSLWGPPEDPDAAAAYIKLAEIEVDLEGDARQPSDREHGADEREKDGEVSIRFGLLQASPFMSDDLEQEASLLSSSQRYQAPALVDVDGRAGLDLVVRGTAELALHLSEGGQIPALPTRTETLPEALRDGDVSLRLVDLDADGDLDLLAHVVEDSQGLENRRHQLLLYTNDGSRIVREKPDQVLRFEAGVLVVEVVDVDGDGLPDLSLRKLELPSFLSAVGGLSFTFSHLVYLRTGRGFSRKPALKEETVFDEDSVVDIIANRELVLDCDGDGIADLVEVDARGRVTIRRLKREKSFLGGVTWSLEAAPWKRFDAGGSIESLSVEDINGDGLGDVFSASSDRLTILVSGRAGAAR
ncbi:MAG: hypothetical protein ACI8QZ_001412 [Chlamydiales bacterium]|jgi:hypothetical protein